MKTTLDFAHQKLPAGSAGFTDDLVVVYHALLGPQQSYGRMRGVDGVQRPRGRRLCGEHTKIIKSEKVTSERVSADDQRSLGGSSPQREVTEKKFHIQFHRAKLSKRHLPMTRSSQSNQ